MEIPVEWKDTLHYALCEGDRCKCTGERRKLSSRTGEDCSFPKEVCVKPRRDPKSAEFLLNLINNKEASMNEAKRSLRQAG